MLGPYPKDDIKKKISLLFRLLFMVFNATFNNIPGISWRSVLLVEETGVVSPSRKSLTNYIT